MRFFHFPKFIYFWKKQGITQFSNAPKIIKNGFADPEQSKFENRSGKFSGSKNFRRISIGNFRKIENPKNFRKIEKSKKVGFQLKIFENFSISKNIFDRFLIKSKNISVESIFKIFGS